LNAVPFCGQAINSSLVKDIRLDTLGMQAEQARSLGSASTDKVIFMSGVLCVGIAVLDHVYRVHTIPTTPEKHRAQDLALVGGGLAANAAVAVARLGGRSYLASRLGADMTGTIIVEGLEIEGVDCRYIWRFDAHKSPVSAVLVDNSGERMVVSYADAEMPTYTDWLPDQLPSDVEAVHGDTRWIEGALHLFGKARQLGYPALLDADRAPSSPEVYTQASHIVFSKQGLCEATGCSDAKDGVAMLGRTKSCWIGVTAGNEGVYHWNGERVVHTPGFTVAAMDTLAAGDVWHGAFALALAEGQAEKPAIRFASATAALKCTRFGGRTGTPVRAEVEAFLREKSDG
jgi:sulfofructose kinase